MIELISVCVCLYQLENKTCLNYIQNILKKNTTIIERKRSGTRKIEGWRQTFHRVLASVWLRVAGLTLWNGVDQPAGSFSLFFLLYLMYIGKNECGSTLFSLCGIWIKESACTLWSSYDIGTEECQDTIIDRYILGEGIHSFINILFRICFDSSKRFSQELTCFLLY